MAGASNLLPRPRVAEVVAVLSMATDLGLGLPMEHAVRTCLMSMELGRRLGMSSAELGELYYLTLLRMLGCTTGSAENAYLFGDEVAFGRSPSIPLAKVPPRPWELILPQGRRPSAPVARPLRDHQSMSALTAYRPSRPSA